MKRKLSSGSSSSGRRTPTNPYYHTPPRTGKRRRSRSDDSSSVVRKRHKDDYEERLALLLADSSVGSTSDASLGSVISSLNTQSNAGKVRKIIESDTPWQTMGEEAGAFIGSTVGAAGGPLGSVVGGAGGAVVGGMIGSAGDWAVSQLSGNGGLQVSSKNNMPKAGFAPFNSGKSSVASKGRVKVSSSNKRVRVSKKLREKVKKVIQGSRPQGVYRFQYHGFIGLRLTDSTAATEQVVNATNTTNNVIAITRRIPALLNSKEWWAGMLASEDQAVGVPVVTGAGCFEFFTPTKFLNAASVLFNGKTMPDSGRLDEFNMFLSIGSSPAGTVVQKPQKYVVHINNSKVMLAFKNCSARVLIVDFYVCTMKMKTLTPSGLDFITEAIVADSEVTVAAANMPVFKSRDTLDREEQINYTLTNMSFDPAMCPTFRARFKYEKLTMTIQPGETITKSIQGPKNYDLDYSKITDIGNGLANPNLLYKPTTVQCFASIRPDQQFITGGVNDVSTTYGNVSAVKGFLNRTALPVCITMEEVFDMSMPDSTGFQYQTPLPVAGQHQTLNSRFNQKRIYINDRRVAAGQGTTTYLSVNEENPAVNNAITTSTLIY